MKQKYVPYCSICAVILLCEAVVAQQYCTPLPGPSCDTDKIMNVNFADISNHINLAWPGYYRNILPFLGHHGI